MLTATIEKLFEKRIVLDFTDHLSDYQLYGLIFRDILPSHEKKLERRTSYLHWDCANINESPDMWLRYYATPADRTAWAEENDQPLPPREEPPFKRRLPRAAVGMFDAGCERDVVRSSSDVFNRTSSISRLTASPARLRR